MVTHLIGLLILLYLYLVMLPAALLSWFRLEPGTPLSKARFYLNRATQPLLTPLRRVIPPVGGLDLSFFVLFLALQILAAKLY